jgi:membrane protein DedA with SNARE-associated domain/rhodanese-related sulfurtransferase
METVSAYFAHYGLLAVFAVVLVKQLGAPLPASVMLVLAGAAAADHALFGVEALVVATAASTLADFAWFLAGRRFGRRVLALVCRVSISPDSCVRKNEASFARRGAATLVIAKFVPGLGTIAPPLAGALGMTARSFALYSAAAAALWAGAGIVCGVLFHEQILWLLAALADLGRRALWPILALAVLYVAFRVAWRRRELRQRERMPKVQAAELAAMIERGLAPLIIDVRARELPVGDRIPGARAIDLAAIGQLPGSTPQDGGPIVVYCDCPNDASATRAVVLLAGRGIRASVLQGGMAAWVQAGYPLATV